MTGEYIYHFENEAQRQEAIDVLRKQVDVSGTELISFYATNYSDSRISKLKDQLSQAKSIKSKKTQLNVSTGLETLIEVLSRNKSFLYNKSFAVFVKVKFYLLLVLPSHISKNTYHCDKKFVTYDLEHYSPISWGLVVLDNNQVSIGVLTNNRIQLLQNYDVFIPGKIKAGGQSQYRFEQTRKNLVADHVKTVSEKCNKLFPEKSISVLLLGGTVPTSEQFYFQNSLRPDLKQILTPPTPVIYMNRKGLEEVLEKNRSVYSEAVDSYFKNQKLYQKIMRIREDLHTQTELCHLQNYRLKKIYTSQASLSTTYCERCNRIRNESVKCEHDTKSLKDVCPIERFDLNSEWGCKFRNRYKTLYEINILET